MILVHDAGASRRSAFFDHRTLPVRRSMRMPLRAWTPGAAVRGRFGRGERRRRPRSIGRAAAT